MTQQERLQHKLQQWNKAAPKAAAGYPPANPAAPSKESIAAYADIDDLAAFIEGKTSEKSVKAAAKAKANTGKAASKPAAKGKAEPASPPEAAVAGTPPAKAKGKAAATPPKSEESQKSKPSKASSGQIAEMSD